ncbi:phosphoheptose isomerase [Polynucleobacter sp. IMCC30063]|uniref:phosphoheptose isomerase n=1 Tax=Polynucleobacter sp. IMCC30063 TaxID=2907298 RepID=UPI001F273AA1|nr:phosphoheptose isomerase [Polynucleobacter sp. IMCC30063]MCE7504913.1 phosphoheptose isomerase [Polynucleobacter sp. IMCC30063]
MNNQTLPSLETRTAQHFLDSIACQEAAAKTLSALAAQAILAMANCLQAGGKIMACGNGGSAADAQHFAAELIGRFERERRELAAIALTTDTSILTAVGNDYSYDEVFSKQVRGLGKTGDILLAITTSGNSKNVLKAIVAAQSMGIQVIAFSGNGGGQLSNLLGANDLLLCAPASRTARIQETHLILLHALCDGIDHVLLD